MARMTTHMDMDLTGMSFANGMINGVSTGIQDRTFSGTMLKYTHSILTEKFELWMDAMALQYPSNLTHVYEWEQLGRKTGRLWESVLTGRGANRTASIIWKASLKASPVDPELLIPGPTGKAVKRGVHIFYWKAPVMEAGLQIDIKPKLSPTLTYMDNQGRMQFTKDEVSFEAGGGKTTGQFTRHYYAWWMGFAQNIFNTEIAPQIQANIVRKTQTIKPKSRKNARLSSLSVDFRRGRTLGILGLKDVKRDYESAARARRAFLYGT